ncbi:MAG: thioredoxin [Planctomycetaceae bacterium]|nr:thioredoxin [Planctomycetaceae bacterium]
MLCLAGFGCGQHRSLTLDTINSELQFSQEVLSAERVVVVDFAASWCGPCHMMEPVLESLAADYGGRAQVKQVDVDEVPELATKYEIQALPTIVFFRNGEEVGRAVGVKTYLEMQQLLEAYLHDPQPAAPAPEA